MKTGPELKGHISDFQGSGIKRCHGLNHLVTSPKTSILNPQKLVIWVDVSPFPFGAYFPLVPTVVTPGSNDCFLWILKFQLVLC